MTARTRGVGVAAAACAACCATPIAGALGLTGVFTAAGFAAIGVLALVAGGAIAVAIGLRRRRTRSACPPSGPAAVTAVALRPRGGPAST